MNTVAKLKPETTSISPPSPKRWERILPQGPKLPMKPIALWLTTMPR